MNWCRAFKVSMLMCWLVINLQGCASGGGRSSELMDMVTAAERSYNLGLLSDAEAQYRRILKRHPDYYEAWLKLGNIFTRTDQLSASIGAYEECLELKPEEMRCWNNLAIARLKQSIDVLNRGKAQMVKGSAEYQALDAFYMKLVSTISQR